MTILKMIASSMKKSSNPERLTSKGYHPTREHNQDYHIHLKNVLSVPSPI